MSDEERAEHERLLRMIAGLLDDRQRLRVELVERRIAEAKEAGRCGTT